MNKKKKIISNFFTKNYLFTIITAIVISIISILDTTLSMYGKGSSTTSSIFDISECDQVINATTPTREMIHGSITNDCIYGGEGNDILYGGLGHDILYGFDGYDQLIGDSGNDKLYGGAGDDDLVGGLGMIFLMAEMEMMYLKVVKEMTN